MPKVLAASPSVIPAKNRSFTGSAAAGNSFASWLQKGPPIVWNDLGGPDRPLRNDFERFGFRFDTRARCMVPFAGQFSTP